MKKYILQLFKSMTFGIALVLGSILGLVGVYATLNWDGLTANVQNDTPLTKDLWNNTIGTLKSNIDALDTRMTNVENSGGGSASTGNPFSFVNGTSKGADGIVKDSTTGLMWESKNSGGKTWEQAKAHCTGLTKGGYDNWRLPEQKEFINFYTKWFASGAFLSDYFSLGNYDYWSATSYGSDHAWGFIFTGGGMSTNNKTASIYVLCVR